MARALRFKPIITVDEEGRSASVGKSFSRRANFRKIIRMISDVAERDEIWRYAIVHALNPERANLYADRIQAAIGMTPAFVMDVSPVIGVHSGIGTVGIAWMKK